MKTKILLWILILLVFVYSASAVVKVMQDEDDAVVYSAEDISYTITVSHINDGKAIFEINDEESSELGYHETYRFEDGSIVFVREILEEEVMEGPDKVIFNFYPAECSGCDFSIADFEETDGEEEPVGELLEAEELSEDIEEADDEEIEEEIIIIDKDFEEAPKKKGYFGKFVDWFVNWFIWWED